MLTCLRLLLALACAAAVLCGQPREFDRSTVASVLGFEADPAGGAPGGWWGGPAGTLFTEESVVHGGRRALRIERGAGSADAFSAATLSIPMGFAGKTIEMRGFLRTEGVTGFAGLWMREDGDTPALVFDNMTEQRLDGTTGWKEYSIRLPVHPDATRLYFGVLLAGTGKAWADDLQLLVDGKPIAEAPATVSPKTALDGDREFDGGSKIALTELTAALRANLVTLGKVWGFLKYHHPRVTGGQRHWDYELFRILPKTLAARDRAAGNAAMAAWVASLGPVEECTTCARLGEAGLQLRPQLDWLSDEALLGKELSAALRSIYRNRPAAGARQFYVGIADGVGNPVFRNEPLYASIGLPDSGYQLLALYRFWNMVEYWFPYRDAIGESWDAVLARFVPRLALAKSSDAYQLELTALIASIHDTHASLSSPTDVRPPRGGCEVPLIVRFLEGKAVVTGYADAKAGPETGLKIGDVIAARDGAPIPALVEQWTPYYAASNQPTRLRDIARSLLRGACGEPLRVRREGGAADLSLIPSAPQGVAARAGFTHDLPGDAFRLLSKDVAYLKMSAVKHTEADSYINRATGAKGLVIDLRNYPSAFLAFALAGALVERETPFARFTIADLSNPGAFCWGKEVSLVPQKLRFDGKVVVLVDEVTVSSAEYSAMAFRAAPRVTVIGGTTAGADGNVSAITLPGGLRSRFSGIGVFYPDKRPTQRVGIVPDIEVRPTIAGVREGRDELLEEALRRILGPDVPLAGIRKLIPAVR
jgi:hypothetical protein